MTSRHPYCETEYRGTTYECFVVPAKDGTPLAVKRTGVESNPPLIVANGVGVPWFGMHLIMEDLQQHFCVYTWDYRGVGESEPVIEKEFSMERHAADALDVANWFGLERFALVGWSMGVPVLLEIYRAAPERVTQMAFLYGAPGLPYVAALGRFGDRIFRALVKSAIENRIAPLLIKKFIYRYFEPFVVFLGHSGFTSTRCDAEIIRKNVRAVLDENTLYYGSTLLKLGTHSGWDILPRVTVPTLVVGGGKDWVTPDKTMKKMAETLAEAQWILHPRASHFGVIEEGENLLAPLRAFLTSNLDT